MTKFADPSFTVAAPTTKAYADGYAQTFPKPVSGKDCTICEGSAKVYDDTCTACAGTGLRSYQHIVE